MWNKFQKNIFKTIQSSPKSLVVQARAGTGKTTTIVEALNHIDHDKESTILCAFNKSIQTELKRKAPADVTVKTLHAIGYSALARQVGSLDVDIKHTRGLIKEVIEEAAKARKTPERYETIDGLVAPNLFDRRRIVGRLVSLAKNTLTSGEYDLQMLAKRRHLDEATQPANILADIAQEILTRQFEDNSPVCDFDDMLWKPAIWGLNPRSFDNVFVDEAQDLNAVQMWMVSQMLKDDMSRLVAVGDNRQAIYAWRGAGRGVLDAIHKDFNTEQLPLSITYRCPQKVVSLVNRFVPDYRAAPNAPDGIVKEIWTSEISATAQPGCFILSRTNAPLMPLCLDFLRRGVPAKINGRDIGMKLVQIVEKSQASSIKELLLYLEKKKKDAIVLYAEDEDRIAAEHDTCNAVAAVANGLDTPQQVVSGIQTMFGDKDDSAVITLSTVHRAKGLERDIVFMLADTFNQDSKREEEENLYYVAATRTKKELYLAYEG